MLCASMGPLLGTVVMALRGEVGIVLPCAWTLPRLMAVPCFFER